MKSLADIIAYNSAHADEAIKCGQGQLTASQAVDLTDPAQNATYVDGARHAAAPPPATAIDNALTTNTLDAIMTPSGTLTGIGARAGYPQIVVPAGYNAQPTAAPVGIAFNGTAYSEAKLLAFAYAYEQATQAAQAGQRDQPRDLALLRRQRRAPARPGKRDRHRRHADVPARDGDRRRPPARMTAGTLSAVTADQGLHAADRAAPTPRARRSTPSALINPKALAGGGGAGRRARRRDTSAGRCTASR